MEEIIKNLLEKGCVRDIQNAIEFVKNNEIAPTITLENGTKVYDLIDGVESTITLAEINKLKNILGIGYIFVIKKEDGTKQVFFYVVLGRNGGGDFIKNDMRDFANFILKDVSKSFPIYAVTSMEHDILDDVSYWGVTVNL